MDSTFITSPSISTYDTRFDYITSILDEIALEGLDGITLSTLWIRLQNRPHFPIAVDSNSKVFFWEIIAVHKQVEMFELPESRPTLILINRFESTDDELDIPTEPVDIPPDIYPISMVNDDGIKGSCATYNSRKCITAFVRKDATLLMTLQEAVEKWGGKLVLVASPKIRRMSLYGMESCALLDLPVDMYCLLERIGRARYMGEVTQGEMGLLATKAPFASKVHYFCIKLIKDNLVTKQLHYLRTRNGQSISGSLFHLKRFYVQRKSKMEILMNQLCEVLKNKPDRREVSKTLRLELGVKESTFKKLFHKSSDIPFEASFVPHKEMYPNATEKECLTSNGQERLAKVVRLLHTFNEEEENKKGLLFSTSTNSTGYFDPSKISFEKPLIFQVYEIINSAGPEGITAQEICKIMTLPWLQVRWLCKQVEKSNVVVTLMQDRGRQRVTKYISKNFAKTSECFMQVKEQQKKFLGNPLQVELIDNKCNSSMKVATESLISNNSVTNTDTKEKDQNSDYQDIVSEVIMVSQEDMLINSNSKNTERLKELLVKAEPKAKFDNHITFRMLKRANIILEILRTVKIALVFDLKKIIVEQEMKEGYSWRMDKKSTLRLLDRLKHNGLIKYVNIKLKLGNAVKVLRFVCDPTVKEDDQYMEIAIEQAKFKYFGVSSKVPGVEKVPKKELLDATVKPSDMEYEPSAGRTVYGLQPKFIRAKTLHSFLFYLTRNYEGKQEIHKEPFVYHDSNSWKRFVPPLPNYSKYHSGWCLLADTILCMPLSIFLKIVNLRYRISGLQEYIEDNVKGNYLIKHLPQELRNCLLCGGRYKFIIHEILCRLCYMGLLSFGPQQKKDKDQVFIYIHRNASIMDTSISPPGYIFIDNSIEYTTKKYEFDVLSDVDAYWMDLGNICFHTNLSRYNAARGQNITLVNINHKEAMIKALEGVDFDKIIDDGCIPGDHLGAAGLDSALFAHMKRNWCWSTDKSQFLMKDLMKHTLAVESLSPEKNLVNYLKFRVSENMFSVGSKRRLQRINQNAFLKSVQCGRGNVPSKRKRQCTDPLLSGNSGVKHVAVRTVERKEIKRKPYYDDKDMAAMKKMCKQRVDWSQKEDNFLLLCKVASLFLDPKSKRLVVPFTVVRDLIHEEFPNLSCNKSSRACQRRVRYMMINPITSCDVGVLLGEARQDIELVKQFDRPKPPKTKEEEWKIMFTDVLKKLEVNFRKSSSDRCKKYDLPSDLESFHERFDVKTPVNVTFQENCHQDPSDDLDVCRGVIYSLLLSSLSTVGDKQNWSYTFYKLYKQYPSELLNDVINKLCKEHLITKKRDYHKVMHSGPMTSIPFRFTYMYKNAFITKYPTTVFEQSFQFLQQLTCNKSKPIAQFDGEVCAGYCGTILSLMHLEQLDFLVMNSDQIFLLDTSLRNEENHTKSLGKGIKDSLKTRACGEHEHTCKKRRLSIANTNPTPSGSNISGEMPTIKASRIALYMLRKECSQPLAERAQHSQDYFAISSSPSFCVMKHVDDCPDLVPFPVNPKRVCEEIFETSCTPVESAKATCIQKCLLDVKVINKIASSQSQYIPSSVLIREQGDKSLEQVYKTYSSSTLNDAQIITMCIFRCKEIGISHTNLWNKFPTMKGSLSFHAHLGLLMKEMMIFRVGVTCFRYVSAVYARKWIVSSFIIPKEMRLYVNENLKNKRFSHELDSLMPNVSSDTLETEGLCIPWTSETERVSDKASEININEPVDEEIKNADCEAPENNYSSTCELNSSVSKRKCDEILGDQTSTVHERIKRQKTEKGESISFNKNVFPVVNFISRIWRKPDGSLNRPVLANLLTVVCCHIAAFPGLTDSQICERFYSIMQPVQTLEILELLEEACCICRYHAAVNSKPSLFSSPCEVSVTKKLKPGNLTFFVASVDMTMRIGKLREKLMLKH